MQWDQSQRRRQRLKIAVPTPLVVTEDKFRLVRAAPPTAFFDEDVLLEPPSGNGCCNCGCTCFCARWWRRRGTNRPERLYTGVPSASTHGAVATVDVNKVRVHRRRLTLLSLTVMMADRSWYAVCGTSTLREEEC